MQALVAFSVMRWAWVTGEELALLEIPITFAAVALWGAFDRFVKPHLREAAVA